MERQQHRFQFKAEQIADAAKSEAEYHETRIAHWAERRDKALEAVKQTISAEVTETEVTGGVQASVQVKYGDPEAWQEYRLAYSKVQSHASDMDEYLVDEQLYRTQGDRVYDLDTEDVQHFRLGGQVRTG